MNNHILIIILCISQGAMLYLIYKNNKLSEKIINYLKYKIILKRKEGKIAKME